MRNVFVETENVLRFQAALRSYESRGAGEREWIVVDGEPGLGKTTAMYRWAVQTGALFLRTKKEWNAGWFLDDAIRLLGAEPAHAYKRRWEQAMELMQARKAALDLAKKTFALVIDEADHISRSERMMETIRDFSDLGELMIVLVGMGKVRDNIRRFPQIRGRVVTGGWVRFDKASEGDARKLADALCEVPVADDLVAFAHEVSGGYNRDLKEVLARIERWGRRNGAGPNRPVTLAQMAGEVIMNDRETGAPVVVGEAV